jgi:hypothetical protein
MTSFTVRVELHEAKDGDYEKLHEAMEKRGFRRWIATAKGKLQLPSAEYSLSGSKVPTRDEVLKSAISAAKSVKPNPEPWVLVTATEDNRATSGLKLWKE